MAIHPSFLLSHPLVIAFHKGHQTRMKVWILRRAAPFLNHQVPDTSTMSLMPSMAYVLLTLVLDKGLLPQAVPCQPAVIFLTGCAYYSTLKNALQAILSLTCFISPLHTFFFSCSHTAICSFMPSLAYC